jgi:methylenetetrahydrofolate reductase (NADPH)
VVDRARFEVLPTDGIEEQAAALPEPVRLTVTCSPVHGPDRAVEVAGRLREAGRHPVTVHIAARMVRDRAHLDALLRRMGDAGADDLFLIGGDVECPQGAYASAAELLPLIHEHQRRPRAIGIAGYPEKHPLVSDAELERALHDKSGFADYVTTQMCFDAGALHRWVQRERERGLTLPVLIGMPGKTSRRRLLTMATRIGVGPSMRFLRRLRGLRSLLTRRSTADRLYEETAPLLAEPELGIAGFQYFTFNALIETVRWHQRREEDTS